MATIKETENKTIIDFANHKVIVPSDFSILNPEDVANAKCAFLCELRCNDETLPLPKHSIWLDPNPYIIGYSPDEERIQRIYLDKNNANNEQRGRFKHWDELCKMWDAGNRSTELISEIKANATHNSLSIWPIVKGSIVEKYYFPKSGE